MSSVLFGTLMWGGTCEGLPAVVGSYHNGASLYVFRNDKWERYAKGGTVKSVTPHKCDICGCQQPPEEKES